MRLVHWFLAVLIRKDAFVRSQHVLPVNDKDWAESNEYVFLWDEVTNITITMAEDDLDGIIADTSSDLSRNCTVRFKNSKVDQIVSSVGIRARGGGQRGRKKFPWKLEFNEFIEGRKFLGCEKMNLQGDAHDPSLSRNGLSLDIFRSMGIPASRSSYVWLTINDGTKVQGVYNNVEQVDEEFAQAWLDSKDGDNYKCRRKQKGGASLRPLVPNTVESYETSLNYEEKRTGSYQLLKDFIDFIDSADDLQFRNEIKNWINMDSLLRVLAVDAALGNWDGLWLNGNNYYLMYDINTALFEYIPWDLDNTFGTDWTLIFYPAEDTDFSKKKINDFGIGCHFVCNYGDNGSTLIHRVLNITTYEKQVEKYILEVVKGPFSPPMISKSTERIHNLIQPLMFMGAFSGPTMDRNYTNEEFVTSFENPSVYKPKLKGPKWGILPFSRERTSFVLETYLEENLINIPVVVNEVVATNTEGITDEEGKNEDWVEIYNNSDESIDLSGFYLTDTYGLSRQWQIPSGTVISAREYLVIWCDDDEDDGPLHTNFKLSSSGEGVYMYATLSDDIDILVSSLIFPELEANQAYGRLHDGGNTVGYLETPTPSASNKVNSLTIYVEEYATSSVDLVAAGASPNGTVVFLDGEVKTFRIPPKNPCKGVLLDVSPKGLENVISTLANGAGVASTSSLLTGKTYYQSLDLLTCETSNVLSVN